MKELLKNTYGNDLLMVYETEKLVNKSYKALAVIRSNVEKIEIEGVLTCNYDEDFESQLAYKVPAKTRKPAKLLSLEGIEKTLKKITYGTIGCIVDDMPYTYAINYLYMDGHIYFHTGRKGYKLAAIGTKASFNVVEDLGMAYNGTHNFRSIQVYGTLKPNEDYDTKKKMFEKMITDLNPNHPPYVDSMQQTTLLYEIEIDYMMGRENLYLPGDGN